MPRCFRLSIILLLLVFSTQVSGRSRDTTSACERVLKLSQIANSTIKSWESVRTSGRQKTIFIKPEPKFFTRMLAELEVMKKDLEKNEFFDSLYSYVEKLNRRKEVKYLDLINASFYYAVAKAAHQSATDPKSNVGFEYKRYLDPELKPSWHHNLFEVVNLAPKVIVIPVLDPLNNRDFNMVRPYPVYYASLISHYQSTLTFFLHDIAHTIDMAKTDASTVGSPEAIAKRVRFQNKFMAQVKKLRNLQQRETVEFLWWMLFHELNPTEFSATGIRSYFKRFTYGDAVDSTSYQITYDPPPDHFTSGIPSRRRIRDGWRMIRNFASNGKF